MSHVPERSKALSLDLIVAIGLKNIFGSAIASRYPRKIAAPCPPFG